MQGDLEKQAAYISRAPKLGCRQSTCGLHDVHALHAIAAAALLRIRAVQQTPTVARKTGLFLALRLPEPAAPNQMSSSAVQPESARKREAALHRTSWNRVVLQTH